MVRVLSSFFSLVCFVNRLAVVMSIRYLLWDGIFGFHWVNGSFFFGVFLVVSFRRFPVRGRIIPCLGVLVRRPLFLLSVLPRLLRCDLYSTCMMCRGGKLNGCPGDRFILVPNAL